MLLHRFSTQTFFKYHERLKDDVKLRRYVADKRAHSTDDDLDNFIAVMHAKMHDIHQVLSKVKSTTLENSGAKGIGGGVHNLGVFGKKVRDRSLFKEGYVDDAGYQFNPVDNAIIKVTAVPLARLYMLSNYTMSLHEVMSGSSQSGYAIELRLYSPQGAQVLASSDWPVTVKGIKLKTKTPAGVGAGS